MMECSQQLSSSSSEDVDAQIAQNEHVCVVCGDAATAYRYNLRCS